LFYKLKAFDKKIEKNIDSTYWLKLRELINGTSYFLKFSFLTEGATDKANKYFIPVL